MKKTLAFALVLVLVTLAGWAGDISLKEILQTNYQSSGGLDNIKKLKSVYFKGKVTIPLQNLEIPMEMWYQEPNKVRTESNFQGMAILQVYDGETAWGVIPFAGITEPQKLPEDQAREVIEQAEGMYPLLDYEEKGHQVEYEGREDLEGTEVYKLKFTRKDGRVVYFYLDTESCIELKTLTYIKQNESEYKTETYYGDYKEFDGLMFPTSLQVHINGQHQTTISFEEVKTNVSIDPALFILPEKTR